MTNKSEMVTDTLDREIINRRLLNAPRELVFKAFTQPEHLAKWWGPNGFTITMHEFDLRPGGMWRVTLHGPDGHDYPNKMVFLEIVKPELIVIKHLGEEPEPVTHELRIMLEERGDKTNLTMQLVFDSAAERERVVTRYNAIEGGIQTVNRLEQHLSELTSESELVITREFNAPRELVFKMWTETEHLAHWWGPKGFELVIAELDLRPGGTFHYQMRSPDGFEMWGKFAYHEIDPPQRLVFVSSFSDMDGNITRAPFNALWPLEVINVLTLEEVGGKTKLTLAGGPVNATEEELKIFREGVSSMQQGFGGTFDQLDEYLAIL